MCPLFPSTFLQSVHDVLGSNARPIPIHFFSLKHNLFVAQPLDSCRRFLLALRQIARLPPSDAARASRR